MTAIVTEVAQRAVNKRRRAAVKMISTPRYSYPLACLTLLLTSSIAQDILGCGGFLKSHADIDFTKVHVRL